jgi:hypothetical protein
MWHRVEKKGIELMDNSLYRMVDMRPYRHGVLFLMIDAQMDLTIVPHDLSCNILST